jgi:hypothetical protein
VVYIAAGLAKLNSDWLLRAEPVHGWLRSHTSAPLIGQIFAEKWLAYGMSWFGAAFDLSVVWLLCMARTRRVGVLLALGFHVAIWLLFPVGVFSLVMLLCVTIFFHPSWPRRILPESWLQGLARPGVERPRPWTVPLATGMLLVQALLPFRYLAYPGSVQWTEDGFRFAWRVMLMDKVGRAEFRVRAESPGRTYRVFPQAELTALQARMMSTQPDMVLDYAHHLRQQFEANGHENVRVFADVWVSLNGRRSSRLIDPLVDLAAVPRGLGASSFVLPQP